VNCPKCHREDLPFQEDSLVVVWWCAACQRIAAVVCVGCSTSNKPVMAFCTHEGQFECPQCGEVFNLREADAKEPNDDPISTRPTRPASSADLAV